MRNLIPKRGVRILNVKVINMYTGDQVFPATEGLAQTNSIYPFLDNLTAGGHTSSSHGRKIRIISSLQF